MSEDKLNEIRLKAIDFMIKRGWKRLLAKSRQFTQSLFEHTIVELDTLIQLLPILKRPNHFNLNEEEEKILIASIICHDVGKARQEWQEYIKGQRSFISDVDSELTKRAVPEICEALEFNEIKHSDIENCINLHMKHERTDGNVLVAMLQKDTGRWKTLGDLVDTVDNLCSIKGLFPSLDYLEKKTILSSHLKISYHQVRIRGTSTTLLHKAAIESFCKNGWIPLLYYADSTLYVSSAADNIEIPSIEMIKDKLKKYLNDAIDGSNIQEFIVGSPTGNILPKVELFDYKEIKQYLKTASKKIGRTSFIKKKLKEREPVIKKYLEFKGIKHLNLSEDEIDKQSRRLSEAQPEMMIFKFFKAAVSEEMIGKAANKIVAEKYEETFGDDSWKYLLTTSTLMQAKDMAYTVDYFWSLPGEKFEKEVKTIEELSWDKRVELLVNILSCIANEVYSNIKNPPSRSNLASEMASAFIKDLIKPADLIDFKELVNTQIEAYSKSKPFAGKQTKKAEYLCPICNVPFNEGTKASADFIDNPESHTNRGVSHGGFGYVTICNTCKHERILRQILLGQKPSETIVLMPRMNISYGSGKILTDKINKLYSKAYILMTGENEDPDKKVSFALTQIISKNMEGKEIYSLSSEELVNLITYEANESKVKEHRKNLEKLLKEDINMVHITDEILDKMPKEIDRVKIKPLLNNKFTIEDLTDELKKNSFSSEHIKTIVNLAEIPVESLNDEWNTHFDTLDEAITCLIKNKVKDSNALQLRAEAYKLIPSIKIICETPNLILFPLMFPISVSKESETNSGIRRLFISILLGLALDCTVSIIKDNEDINFRGGEGVAFVPYLPELRSLIGLEWLSIEEAEKWFKAIKAASSLAIATNYPERSNLYEILKAPTPGHILRRIEQKSERGVASIYHIKYLEEIKEVLK